MTEQEKVEKFAKCKPPLSKQEIDNLNKLFPAYIFRHSRTAEVWTSCCGWHEHLGESPSERAILYAEHQREPKHYSEGRPKPVEVCSFCGEPVVIKELGRTGRQDNLCNWKRAVILRWYRGALWARAYELKKEYGSEYELTAKPKGALLGVYRFRPGLAESTTRSYSGYPFQSISRKDGPLTGGRFHIHGPFASNAEYGVTYDVIGLDEIQKKPFQILYARRSGEAFFEIRSIPDSLLILSAADRDADESWDVGGSQRFCGQRCEACCGNRLGMYRSQKGIRSKPPGTKSISGYESGHQNIGAV